MIGGQGVTVPMLGCSGKLEFRRGRGDKVSRLEDGVGLNVEKALRKCETEKGKDG